jgi:hypothetical protein
MIRYSASHGALTITADGPLVEYDVAKRDIERLGNELFAARVAIGEAAARHNREVADLRTMLERLYAEKRAAVMALGFDDPNKYRT